MKKNKFTINLLVRQALIASLYVVLTVVVMPLSYGQIQFRIAEVLVLLCFFRHDYIIGLTLGCFIANIFSPMLVYDLTLGVLASFIALVLITKYKNIYVAAIWPVISNAIIVGFELFLAFKEPFLVSALYVGVGEMGVMIVALIIFKLLSLNKKVMYFITLDDKYSNVKENASASE